MPFWKREKQQPQQVFVNCSHADTIARVKELEKQRDELYARLDTANQKEVALRDYFRYYRMGNVHSLRTIDDLANCYNPDDLMKIVQLADVMKERRALQEKTFPIDNEIDRLKKSLFK